MAAYSQSLALPLRSARVTNLYRSPLATVAARPRRRAALNQGEVMKSLEGWAQDHVVPHFKPVEKCWQPHEFLPDSSQPSDEFMEEVRALRDRTGELSDDLFVVLVGDLVTEDALPTYHSMLTRLDGMGDETGTDSGPWATWIRTWSAEENRHGDLLRSYLYLSGRVDMLAVDRTVHHLIANGMDVGVDNSPYNGVVYTSFQERATAISHNNTARLAKARGDSTLAKICNSIASDEKRHEHSYALVVDKLLEVDPTGAMSAIAHMMKHNITMPASLMYDGQDPRLFDRYASVAQRLGVYTVKDYADVMEHFIRRWKLDKVEGLTDQGVEAQEFVCGLPHRIRLLQERAEDRAKTGLNPSMPEFTWIFNKKLLV